MSQYSPGFRYSIVKCICGQTHKCQVINDRITLPNPESCKVTELVDAFVEYKCSECDINYKMHGNSLHRYIFDQYQELYGMYDMNHGTGYDQWVLNWRAFCERFKGEETYFITCSSKVIDEKYIPLGGKSVNINECIGAQLLFINGSYYDGDAASLYEKFNHGTVICRSCSDTKFNDGLFKWLWDH